ncbi:RHS repeat-associated core domain-containing protein [Pseudomonas silesiensis]|uniref:RHS repeat domain-containing protein n=1 Tax=Pseudomonas silesiensis TaxID=1853130 RepID=UPI0030DDBA29
MTTLAHTHLHAFTPTLMAQDPVGRVVRRVAYYRDHLEQRLEPRITRLAYDANGHLKASWDPRRWETACEPGLTTLHSLSAEPLLSNSADAGWKARLAGAAHELRSEWDGRHNQRQIAYDNQLRQIAISEQAIGNPPALTEHMIYADSRSEFASHNQCGRQVRHDDAAGCLRINEYTLNGSRLSESRHFTKDLTAANRPMSMLERERRLEAEGATTQWCFNALGDLLTLTDAQENQQLMAYDITGQLKQIKLIRKNLPVTMLLTNRHYSVSGQIEHETAGNGVETARCYDSQNDRLSQLMSSRPGHPLQNLAYSYDPVGNITQIEDSTLPVRYFKNQRTEPVNQYGYDTLYQLKEATGREAAAINHGPRAQGIDPQKLSSFKQTFSYDHAGNLLTLVHEGICGYTREMVTATSSNRSLTKPDTGEPEFTKSFDSNGNLLILSPGSRLLHWDTRNQLSEVVQVVRDAAQNDRELYSYDSHGQRLRKVLYSKTKSTIRICEVRYLPGLEVHYCDGQKVRSVVTIETGNVNARSLHWHEQPPGGIANDEVRYHLSDHLGSCALELDEEAALISQEGYYAFGGTAWWLARNDAETSYKTIRYSGKERDATGLYYYGLRYYAPWLQRWINPDPAGDIDGLNRYRMVRNNPLRFKDNQGLAPVEPIDDDEREMVAAGHAILYRRVDDLPEKQRREFEHDFSAAIDFTNRAISSLGKEKLSKRTRKKLRNIFGERKSKQYLKMAAQAAKAKLEDILSGALEDYVNGNRFVFTENNPDDPLERAFSFPSKPQADRFIYFNRKALEQSAAYRAGTIFHELSHVHAKTHDYWDLFSASSREDTAAKSEANLKEDIEESLRIAKEGPDLSGIEARLKSAVEGHIHLAKEMFQTAEHQHWGAQIAITAHNADSLTALILQFRHQPVNIYGSR